MANGELCKHCGDQETPHTHREYSDRRTCFNFVSEFTHHEDCPVLDCNGDCAATIKHQDWLAAVDKSRAGRLGVILPNLDIMFVDIGS